MVFATIKESLEMGRTKEEILRDAKLINEGIYISTLKYFIL